MKWFDTRGLEIHTGDSIVYAVKESTSVMMHQATVIGFTDSKIVAMRRHDKKKVWLRNTDTIVVVEAYMPPPPTAESVQLFVSIKDIRLAVSTDKLISHLPPIRVDTEEMLERNLWDLSRKVTDEYLQRTRTLH